MQYQLSCQYYNIIFYQQNISLHCVLMPYYCAMINVYICWEYNKFLDRNLVNLRNHIPYLLSIDFFNSIWLLSRILSRKNRCCSVIIKLFYLILPGIYKWTGNPDDKKMFTVDDVDGVSSYDSIFEYRVTHSGPHKEIKCINYLESYAHNYISHQAKVFAITYPKIPVWK